MALSEEEQKLLAQMEAALAEDDPHLAQTLRGAPNAAVLDKRRAFLAALGFLAGLALLITGMVTHWSVSILGFLTMFLAAWWGIQCWQRLESQKKIDTSNSSRHAFTYSARDAFMSKMEQQWRRRMEDEGRR